MLDMQLYITSPTGELLQPIVKENVKWHTERKSAPGKLTFDVIKDSKLNFQEGAAVRFTVDGKNLFFGFVFTKNRDKENIITVTAYDQLRYLKNKDCIKYENKKASQFIQMVANDYNLQCGEIADTGYIIASRVEDNSTLFDMIENALDLTLTNNKEMFVMYDDFGKITLKNISDMKVGEEGTYLVIDDTTGENYEYTSSIDNDTYNQIKLVYKDAEKGEAGTKTYVVKDSSNINQWGILQYFDTLSEGENGQAKADALLKLYNSKTRKLKITNAFGDVRVRAGCMVVINLNLGDIAVQNFMLVEKVTHKFSLDQHTMDLTLRGGEFIV